MSAHSPSDDDSNLRGGRFATTAWSLVVAAGSREAPQARAALAELCQRYWYPLYAFLRRSGHDADTAADLIQGFFSQLLERHLVDLAQPERGRFRSFLLTSLKNYCHNERRRAGAIKRGGGRKPLSFDSADGEQRYAAEPHHVLTADRLFERKWALQLLERCLERLQQEAAARGRGDLFDAVKPILTGMDAEETYAHIAAGAGLSTSAVKVAVHRWRTRLRDFIREEILETVSDEGEVDQEIEHLFRALAVE